MFAARGGFTNAHPKVITVYGGNLSYDGLYTIRTFNSSGNLIVSGGTLELTDYLIAGAGGNGGSGFIRLGWYQ